MSTAKLMDEGEIRFGQILFESQPVDGNYYLGLYTAPTTEPEETLTMAGITEVTGGAYARKALVRGSWTRTNNVWEYAEQTFLAAGADYGMVYGWFITTVVSGASGKLMALEHFNAPYNIVDGKGIKITPKITIT